MDYAKNFKIKNIIFRSVAFVLYFLASGFMGKMCVILIEPVFLIALRQYPETKNIILYIISAIIMIAAVSFFSRREGYNDTDLLRFSYLRTILSYTISGIIFYCIVFFAPRLNIPDITEYFFTPYFLPDEINNIISDFAAIPKWISLLLSIFLCVVFSMIFYRTGRTGWIAIKKKKIAQAKNQGNKKFTSDL